MWKSGENYFSIANMCIWSDDPSVSRLGRVWAINSFFFCGQSSSWLGLCLSRRWYELKSFVCLLLLLEQLCPRWQMENLQSKSLPWKATSEGAQPQLTGGAGLCCSMLQPHWLQNREKAWIFKNIWICLVFSPLKERLCFWNKIK